MGFYSKEYGGRCILLVSQRTIFFFQTDHSNDVSHFSCDQGFERDKVTVPHIKRMMQSVRKGTASLIYPSKDGKNVKIKTIVTVTNDCT